MTRVLVVDNHDSFVFTLAGYLRDIGANVSMVEADELDTATLGTLIARFDGVMISPGPGTPQEAGASVEMVRACAAADKPLLGVCLGHQAIAVAFGGDVQHAAELVHGSASVITHDGEGLFSGIANPLMVGRYHSLAVVPESLPADLHVTATTDSGIIMAMTHKKHPIVGVQFHPESVLTQQGYAMLGAWLQRCGLATAVTVASGLSPHISA